jgi:hypothetical protein
MNAPNMTRDSYLLYEQHCQLLEKNSNAGAESLQRFVPHSVGELRDHSDGFAGALRGWVCERAIPHNEGDTAAAAALMKPAKEDALVSRPVSKAVGNVKNNGPELLA